MAADTTRLQGEIAVNPEGQSIDVERLLIGFLRSLLEEQTLDRAAGTNAKEVL